MSESLLHRRFESQASQHPNAIALETAIERLTYAEVDHRANQIARTLIASGVKPEMPVGLCAERSVEGIVATLGILKAGGACYSIEPAQNHDWIRSLLENLRPPIIVAQRSMMPHVQTVPATVICLDCERLWGCASAPAVSVRGDHVAYLATNVDSTGASAGIEIFHDSITRLVCDSNALRLTHDDVFPLMEPLTSSGAIFAVWGALLHGGRLAVLPPAPLSCKELASFIRRRRVTVLRLPADQAQHLIDHCLDDLDSLRQLIVTAGVLSTSWIRKLSHRCANASVVHSYSPVAGLPSICYSRIGDGASETPGFEFGRPVDGVFLAILDEHGQPALHPATGELCIGGRCLPRGYLNRPELNAARFIPHPFEPGVRLLRTGDRVRLRDDGTLEFLGRLDAKASIHDRAATEAA